MPDFDSMTMAQLIDAFKVIPDHRSPEEIQATEARIATAQAELRATIAEFEKPE